MKIMGLDIATTTGVTICDTTANRQCDAFKVMSFKPKAPRPFGLKNAEICYEQEAEIARQFRDHIRALLAAERPIAVAIEQPLPPNITRTVTTVDKTSAWAGQAFRKETKGGVTMGTILRIYVLFGIAIEVCKRLGIPVYVVPQGDWRDAFIGRRAAPKGTTDGGKWMKAEVRRQCETMDIVVKNDDQSDSVGIAWWLRGHLKLSQMGRPGTLV